MSNQAFFQGLREMVQDLERMDDVMKDTVPEAANVGRDVWFDEVQARAPRDEGDLAQSMERVSEEMGPGHARAGFKMDFYGYFHEYGTVKMSARPFIRPAVDAKRGEIEAEMQRVVDTAVERMWG
jgi:HK97 gp10 family phage protein